MTKNVMTEEHKQKMAAARAAKKAASADKPSVSLRKAINLKCKDCIYDPMSGLGTWRQQTHGCTAVTCPLWEVRPMSSSGAILSIGETDTN